MNFANFSLDYVDIYEDKWTISTKMRIDIANFFKAHRNFNIAEIGSYKGYTTRFFSDIFHRVYAIDKDVDYIILNQKLNQDRRNISYINIDLYKEGWETIPFDVDVCFIDAVHDYESCKSDIENSLKRFKYLKYIIFDDYATYSGVRNAINEFVINDVLLPESFVGLNEIPCEAGSINNSNEGLICSVINPNFIINQ